MARRLGAGIIFLVEIRLVALSPKAILVEVKRLLN